MKLKQKSKKLQTCFNTDLKCNSMEHLCIELDKISTKQFEDFLIISFSKQWLSLNNDKPIEFSVKVIKNKLILSGNLEYLNNTKGANADAM